MRQRMSLTVIRHTDADTLPAAGRQIYVATTGRNVPLAGLAEYHLSPALEGA